MKITRALFVTPPLLQPNTPYPATMHLKGFYDALGKTTFQVDLSIKVVRDILLEYGGDEVEELLEFLGGNAPAEAKLEASAYVENLAREIREEVDSDFGFARYAEHLCAAVHRFSTLERAVKRRGVMDAPLERHLDAAIAKYRPQEIGVTCPFPGTLVGAFKIARYVRAKYPSIRLALGGGYVNTELRTTGRDKVLKYFDELELDDPTAAAAFVEPSYEGIDWSEYFDIVETDNPVINLWNSGKWRKLLMARGCYWHRCAFCDVQLPYIGKCLLGDPVKIVDAMEKLGGGFPGFHFVDEAMPPRLIRGVAEEILRRGFACEWWGNVRFDAAFDDELVALMAKAGCIAVTGGLECANDRLLALMQKGITLAGARKVLENFKRHGIFVHAYLMYDFPTETAAEERAARKYVKGLERDGLIQSSFWHRFALTVHSPICREPEKFGLEVVRPRTNFALNEVDYRVAGKRSN